MSANYTKHTDDLFVVSGNTGDNKQHVNLNGTYYRYDGPGTDISAWSSIYNHRYEYERVSGNDFFYYLRNDNKVALLKCNLNWAQDPDDWLRFSNVQNLSQIKFSFPDNLPADNTNALPYGFVGANEDLTDDNIEKYTLKNVFGSTSIAIASEIGGGTLTYKPTTPASNSPDNFVLDKDHSVIANTSLIKDIHVHDDAGSRVFEVQYLHSTTTAEINEQHAVWAEHVATLINTFTGKTQFTKGKYMLDENGGNIYNTQEIIKYTFGKTTSSVGYNVVLTHQDGTITSPIALEHIKFDNNIKPIIR